MTWYFDPTSDTFDLYDHTGAQVASDVEFSGVWSDPPGFPKQVVYDEMDAIAVQAYQDAGGTVDLYVLQTLRHAIFDLIEEGTPP